MLAILYVFRFKRKSIDIARVGGILDSTRKEFFTIRRNFAAAGSGKRKKRRMPREVRAQPLGTTTYDGSTMQPDEEIQYAPRSRPVSFYDNFKVSGGSVSRVVVYIRDLSLKQC